MKSYFYTIIATGLLSLASVVVSAQNSWIDKADDAYNRLAYRDAIASYERGIAKLDDAPYAVLQRLAESYRKVNDMVKAEETYKLVVEKSDASGMDYYLYSRVLLANNKYEESQVQLDKYRKKESSSLGGDFNMESIEKLRSTADKYAIEKAAVSTDGYDDFSPVLVGGNLYFSSNRSNSVAIQRTYAWDGKPFLNLYQAGVSADGTSGDVEPIAKGINGKWHEGTASFTADGNTAYFTRNDVVDGKLGESTSGITQLKIYSSERNEDGSWSSPVELSINSSEYSTGHPSVSADGKTLYFVSDREGGQGGSDIYRARKNDDGSWGEAENLGSSVNTPMNDLFPFIHGSGNLYFASEGHLGLGGLDVFIALPNGDGFMTPRNMGYPFNQGSDDFGVWVADDFASGYLSSNRDASSYGDDIFSYTMQPSKTTLTIKVQDVDHKTPVEGIRVSVKAKDGDFYKNGITDAQGAVVFDIEGYGEMAVEAEGDQYRLNASNYTAVNHGVDYEDEMIVEVKEIKPEGPLVTEHADYFAFVPIYFEYDNWKLNEQAIPRMDTIIAIMKDFPEYKIEAYSHADCRGSKGFNQWLSEKRLESTMEYLVGNGLPRERIFGKAMGEEKPVNDCACECDKTPAQMGLRRYRRCEDKQIPDCGEEDHRMNRRTEFRLVRPGR